MSRGPTRRGGKRLSGEDLALWRNVARGLTPLPGRQLPDKDAPDPEPAQSGKSTSAKPDESRDCMKPFAVPAALAVPQAAMMPIDRRTRQKIVRGRLPIDDRIDLHGMTQAEAHAALRRFLRDAQRRGCRVVLIVTGKGKPLGHHHDLHHERGVLRRIVPKWLHLPELRDVVLSVDEAHLAHGGEGALYVRLRRSRGAGP